jgi:hypothetical protein
MTILMGCPRRSRQNTNDSAENADFKLPRISLPYRPIVAVAVAVVAPPCTRLDFEMEVKCLPFRHPFDD